MEKSMITFAILSGLVSLCSTASLIMNRPESDTAKISSSDLFDVYVSKNNKTKENLSSTSLVFPGFEFCDQQASRDLRAYPGDCSKFLVCTAGVLITFKCQNGQVFHKETKVCVPKGSVDDTCTQSPVQQQTCPPGSTQIKAHPQKCAQFYQCGSPSQAEHWEESLRECDYPMLFNPDTERCEHYSMVTCGGRQVPFDPCEYRANTCEDSARCIPCQVRHPSCRGKEDGMNTWEGREPSPYFVICADQRVVYQGMCPQKDQTQIFDSETRSCVLAE